MTTTKKYAQWTGEGNIPEDLKELLEKFQQASNNESLIKEVDYKLLWVNTSLRDLERHNPDKELLGWNTPYAIKAREDHKNAVEYLSDRRKFLLELRGPENPFKSDGDIGISHQTFRDKQPIEADVVTFHHEF